MNPAAYHPALVALLREASAAYRRRDDEQFASLLEQAIRIAPYRQDLYFNLANHHVQTGAAAEAIELFRALAEEYPTDVDALTYLAHWLRYAGETGEAEKTRIRLSSSREARADDLGKIWRIIDQRMSQPVSSSLPKFADTVTTPVVVVLGYLLQADGSVHQTLVGRLEKALEAADIFPDAPIIVTGGVPRSGLVEAEQMRDWLLHRGVRDDRIHEEGHARDMVENIVYSRPILDRLGARATILITSGIDVLRAGATMDICALVNGSTFLVPDAVASETGPAAPLSGGRAAALKIYRDSLRAYGMPMMRTYPELAER